MSETGFRDLFVELPAAVFESLRGICEQAVEKAQTPADYSGMLNAIYPPPTSNFAWLAKIDSVLCEVYGWREIIRVVRDASDASVTIIARLDCGHAQRFSIDELRMLQFPRATQMAELLLDTIDRTERTCQCVQRPQFQEWSK